MSAREVIRSAALAAVLLIGASVTVSTAFGLAGLVVMFFRSLGVWS